MSPGASMVGRACTVTSASHTQGASTAPVMSPGSASVRPTGVASSATKVCLGRAWVELEIGGGVWVIWFVLSFIFICRGFYSKFV